MKDSLKQYLYVTSRVSSNDINTFLNQYQFPTTIFLEGCYTDFSTLTVKPVLVREFSQTWIFSKLFQTILKLLNRHQEKRSTVNTKYLFLPQIPRKTEKSLMWFINVTLAIALFYVKLEYELVWNQDLLHQILSYSYKRVCGRNANQFSFLFARILTCYWQRIYCTRHRFYF